jgi:TRAP transporter 4TM/12TM fusion protein
VTTGSGEQSKFRQLKGAPSIITKILLGAIPFFGIIYVANIPAYSGLLIVKQQYVGLFLTLALISTFLNTPVSKRSSRYKLPWYDIVLALLATVVGGNIVAFYPELMPRLGIITPTNVVLGLIAILLVLEASRRLLGYPVVGIGVLFILYARFAHLLPGILHHKEMPWQRLPIYLYLDPGSLLGIPLFVSATIVFAFILFGQFLFAVGAGQFLSNVAAALLGRYRGGPAKVSVVASALFGSLSGSASANVATTGIITIPLMKRVGYDPNFAAAVEATASTGGLLLPPIMASTAFIMAEFLGIPYVQIAIAAFVPAILYYVAVFAQVHLRAAKDNLKGLPPQDIPSLKNVMKQGWIYVFPVVALLYFLFWLRFRPEASAVYATAVTLLVGLLTKQGRLNLGKFLFILRGSGQAVLDIAIVGGLAGFVIGALSLTGLGISLSNALVVLSGGSGLLLLILAAGAAIVLGMGMPITATYIVLVILIAPALVQTGIQPLAAHLFVMYFGAMSFLTPPVCVAAYVAAGIAGSDPMKTGFQGMRLGIVAYVVPFVFAFSPALLLMGSAGSILLTVIGVLLAVVFIAVAFEGYLFDRLNILKRVGFGLSGFMLIMPHLAITAVGLLLAALLFLWEFRRRRDRGHFWLL